MVQYVYDAWGNHDEPASEIGKKNPFRYRSYFYDPETQLYFLKTRYYDPSIGRFLNADSFQYANPEATDGLNLYVYCSNNPVKYVDPTGKLLFSFLLGLVIGATIGAAVGAVSYVASEAISAAITGEWTWSWGMFAGSILGGAIGGALSFGFPVLGVIGSAAVTGGISTAIGMGLENAFGEANHSFVDIIINSSLSAGISAAFAGVMKYIKIPGFTGRGSISQVARQINTKLFNDTIGSISAKTFGKMFLYSAGYNVFSSISNGIIDAIQYNNYLIQNALPCYVPNNNYYYPYLP